MLFYRSLMQALERIKQVSARPKEVLKGIDSDIIEGACGEFSSTAFSVTGQVCERRQVT